MPVDWWREGRVLTIVLLVWHGRVLRGAAEGVTRSEVRSLEPFKLLDRCVTLLPNLLSRLLPGCWGHYMRLGERLDRRLIRRLTLLSKRILEILGVNVSLVLDLAHVADGVSQIHLSLLRIHV